MKISRRSWHYRVYDNFCYSDEPRDLCSYFWKVALAAALKLAAILAVSFILIGVGTAATLTVYKNAGSVFMWIGIAAVVVAIGYLARRAWKADDPNIAVVFLKARKDRLCPLIEVED